MAKQTGNKPQVDETFMREMISQGLPSKTVSRTEPEGPQVNRDGATPSEQKTGKRKKAVPEDFRETFFKRVELSDRQPLYVSRDTHVKLMQIVGVIGGRKVTVSSYVENILAKHFEAYQDEINELYESQFKKPI